MGLLNNFSLPIMAGPLKGKKWMPASGGKILRIFFSSYEPEQTSAFLRTIKPGLTIFDVGAHVGYYSLLSSVLTGPAGRVVAFEPEPVNSYYLKKHLELNRCANVNVVESAVSAQAGEGWLAAGTGSGTWRLDVEGERRVKVVSLDDYIQKSGLIPDFLKIDVEGAEVEVLRGAAQALRLRPILFISTHGLEVHAASCRILKNAGYHLEPLLGATLELAREVLARPQ